MESHARVVVIGGGVTGCAIIYHLAKMGWRDVVLLERQERTSGSSWHAAGGIHLARTEDQVMALRLLHSRGKRNGIESEFISIAEARRIAPILKTDGIKTVLHEPLKGYCDPASVTQAYAKAARDLGAKVHRFTPVTATRQLPGGEWEVETPAGNIRCEYLVNAAGLWAREVAALAGIDLPLMPVEHHYMVTETIPEIAE